MSAAMALDTQEGPAARPVRPQVKQVSCRSTCATSVDVLLSLFRSVPCKLTEKLRPGPCMLPQESIPPRRLPKQPNHSSVLRKRDPHNCQDKSRLN